MYCLNFYNVYIFNNLKRKLFNSQILKRGISDVCESKIITLTKSKEYDKFKIYRNNIYNNIYENQILHGVKVSLKKKKKGKHIYIYYNILHIIYNRSFYRYTMLIQKDMEKLHCMLQENIHYFF